MKVAISQVNFKFAALTTGIVASAKGTNKVFDPWQSDRDAALTCHYARNEMVSM